MIKVKPNAPLFDGECENLRRKMCKAEKRYRISRSKQDQNEFKRLRRETTEVAKSKKINLIKQKIEEDTSKALY